jgi:hypothetical protein
MERFYFAQVCLVSCRLPVPEWTTLSRDLGNFLLLLVEYIMYPFGLYLFSFFDACDLQVCSFDGVA